MTKPQVDIQEWIKDESNRKVIIKTDMWAGIGTHIDGNRKEVEFVGSLKVETKWSNYKVKLLDIRSLKISSLDLSQCVDLEELNITFCPLLTSVDFLRQLPSPHLLRKLVIRNNNFSSENLDFLKPFVNLETIWLENNYFSHDNFTEYNKPFKNFEFYNKFQGSLKSLKDLNSLSVLTMENTDIDSGLEYLPKSVKVFRCGPNQRENAKVEKLYQLYLNTKTSSLPSSPSLKGWGKNKSYFFWLLLSGVGLLLVYLLFRKKKSSRRNSRN